MSSGCLEQGILTIGRAESLFRLKKGGLIWLQGEAEGLNVD